MMIEPKPELIEFHDADVERIALEAKVIVIDLTNLPVFVAETETTWGIWLHNARFAATGVTHIELTSPLGLGDEADAIYSASFGSGGQAVEWAALLHGVTNCECTFAWAISGTKLRFRADSVRLEIQQRIRRLGTWDLTTRRMRK
jgi:hypothetical protein